MDTIFRKLFAEKITGYDSEFTWIIKALKVIIAPQMERIDIPVESEIAYLIREALSVEFAREREIDRHYTGAAILINRLHHTVPYLRTEKKERERRAVYGFAQKNWKEQYGVIIVADEPVWLLSFEVPNQYSHKKRTADLVGIRRDGGLVVFEAKLDGNNFGPIKSVLEGLDYLACLTGRSNFEQIEKEFDSMKNELGIPSGFEMVSPKADSVHSVIVLAPNSYYEKYDSPPGQAGWHFLIGNPWKSSVRGLGIGFATSEINADEYFSFPVKLLLPQ